MKDTRDTAAGSVPPGWSERRLTTEIPAMPTPRINGQLPWLEIASLPFLLMLWQVAAWVAQSRFLPGPGPVARQANGTFAVENTLFG